MTPEYALERAQFYFDCAEIHRREGRGDQAGVNEEESWFLLMCWASGMRA